MERAFFHKIRAFHAYDERGLFQYEAEKVKEKWLEYCNFALVQWNNWFKCNATRLCNLPILTSQNRARRTSTFSSYMWGCEDKLPCGKEQKQQFRFKHRTQIRQLLVPCFFFFNPYFPLTNTCERQMCSLRHTLILYSIRFSLTVWSFFWLNKIWLSIANLWGKPTNLPVAFWEPWINRHQKKPATVI